MKIKHLLIASFAGAVMLGLPLQIFAQAEPQNYTTSKRISEEDKAALKEIFKDVDPSTYQLRFTDRQGEKKIAMSDLKQLKKIRDPAEAAGLVVLVVVDDGAVYVLAATKTMTELRGLLGEEKMARLREIEKKYLK